MSTFIKKAKYVHGDKYDYSKSIYVNAHTKLTITCPVHGDFNQKPNNHLNKQGCPSCSNNKKYTTSTFIKKAKYVHGDKYDYSKSIYVNAHTKLTITCPVHGDFNQKPTNHLNKQGCFDCGHNIYTLSVFTKKAKYVHGDKYDYSKSRYVNAHTKLTITCPVHGDFNQLPYSHLNGDSCIKCSHEKQQHTLKQFLGCVNNIHNNYYNYTKTIYTGTYNKIIITCPVHGDFSLIAQYHKNGTGCKKCSPYIKTSKLEKLWINSLNINTLLPNYEIPYTRYIVDGYNKPTNTIYEFYGDFWHGNPKTKNPQDINHKNKKTFGELYEKTIIRENKLKKLGYNIITCWESDFI